jgi:transposase
MVLNVLGLVGLIVAAALLAWSSVRALRIVPTVAEEDSRCPHRERDTLVKQRTSTVNRMKSMLIQFQMGQFL